MRNAVIRGLCALVCAIAFHAALVTGALRLGWFSSDDVTLPELDMTSIDLSFSDTPDETVAPVSQPPSPAVEASSPTPTPPDIDTLPPPPAVEFPRPPAIEPPPPPPQDIGMQPPAVEPPPQPAERNSEQEPVQKHTTPQAPRETPPPKPQRPPSVAVQSAPAPSQARVAVDKPPSLRRRIKYEYPEGARQRGEEGDVTLELDISAHGTVDEVRIVESCGFAELEQAAVKAVKRERFIPARSGSSKVPASARLTLTFRLRR